MGRTCLRENSSDHAPLFPTCYGPVPLSRFQPAYHWRRQVGDAWIFPAIQKTCLRSFIRADTAHNQFLAGMFVRAEAACEIARRQRRIGREVGAQALALGDIEDAEALEKGRGSGVVGVARYWRAKAEAISFLSADPPDPFTGARVSVALKLARNRSPAKSMKARTLERARRCSEAIKCTGTGGG